MENTDKPDTCKDASRLESTYDRMVLESNEIPFRKNLAAALCSWLMLAGFVVFPGTFSSLSRTNFLGNSEPGRLVQSIVRNMPLLWVAGICCVLGLTGLLWIWWTLRHNYVWLIGRIFV